MPLRRLLCCLFLGAPALHAEPFTLAYGSCLRQGDTQPVWQGVLASTPSAFVFGGDNVYTDTGYYALREEPARIGAAYAELGRNTDFAALRARIPVFATWDDHDFGRNDAGADYPFKTESKAFFTDFFRTPPDSPVRRREGVYDAHWLHHEGRRIQLILLDTRWFRSPLVAGTPDADCPRIRHGRNTAPGATVLGAEQWAWLAQRLAQEADFHLVVSSIQVLPEEHCYEKWANFPLERTRLIELLLGQASAPVLLLSGDRHLGEISKLVPPGARWPLYELTSSGMNSAGAGEGEKNRLRVLGENVRTDHFATVALDWDSGTPHARLTLRDTAGAMLQTVEISYAAP